MELEAALRDPGRHVVIDVRSPSEFLEDHAPGALNIPVLSDAQRAEVGTEYVQGSPQKARLIGASMASANISRALVTHEVFTRKDAAFLVMCFRGGLRSDSLSMVMREVGFKVEKYPGGYKAYRAALRERLSRAPEMRGTVVMGPTGSGKSLALRSLAAKGYPFIDLEAHAGHRGSRFGPIGLSPRRQKAFESHLWGDLVRLDVSSVVGAGLASPVMLEGESMRIGNCYLPRPFWDWMNLQPQVWVDVPREERARFLVGDYLGTPPEEARIRAFVEILRTLKMELGGVRVEDIERKVLGGLYVEAADILLEHFFDPHYAKHRDSSRRDVTHIKVEKSAMLADALTGLG